ncbi:lipid phosphatase [Mactra antiquata]
MSTARKRTTNQGQNSTRNGSANSGDFRKSERKDTGLLATLLQLDEEYTCRCAVFADKKSKLRPFMKLIEISCHGIPWLFGTLVMILSVHQALHVELLINLFYGLVIDLIVIGILKTVFRRSRPQYNEMDMFATVSIDNYSFPSGHASRAGMLACFFVLCVLDSPKWIILAIFWSFVVTLSRVLLGRHHLVDVICGYFTGIFEYLLLAYLWIPKETCMSWLELYFSHFHL